MIATAFVTDRQPQDQIQHRQGQQWLQSSFNWPTGNPNQHSFIQRIHNRFITSTTRANIHATASRTARRMTATTAAAAATGDKAELPLRMQHTEKASSNRHQHIKEMPLFAGKPCQSTVETSKPNSAVLQSMSTSAPGCCSPQKVESALQHNLLLRVNAFQKTLMTGMTTALTIFELICSLTTMILCVMQAWPTIMMLHLAVDPKLLYNNRKCYYLHVIGPVAIIQLIAEAMLLLHDVPGGIVACGPGSYNLFCLQSGTSMAAGHHNNCLLLGGCHAQPITARSRQHQQMLLHLQMLLHAHHPNIVTTATTSRPEQPTPTHQQMANMRTTLML